MTPRDVDGLRANAPLLAYRLVGSEPEPVVPVEGAAPGQYRALPNDLFVTPGCYAANHRVYDLEREGLYRFIRPFHDNQQRIVFRSDVEALLSAVCWMHSHGSRDDRKPFEAIRTLAGRGKVVMTCGPFAKFAHQLLWERGVESRVVSVKPLAEYDGYDSGHVLLEVRTGERWLLFDADQHGFVRGDGQRLSLLEAVLRIPSGGYEQEMLASSAAYAVSGFLGTTPVDDGYDYGLFMETMFCTVQARRRWYERIMHIPVLHDGGTSYCTGIEGERAEIERLWPELVFLPLEHFRCRFYAAA